MRSAAYSASIERLNQLYRSEAEARAPWVSYLSTWEAFSAPGEPGRFTSSLTGPDGQPVTVRFDDIHFNVAGSEMLATMVLDHVATAVR